MDKSKKQDTPLLWWIIGGVLVVAGVFVLAVCLMWVGFQLTYGLAGKGLGETLERSAQIGDTLGVVNTLFSGLALLGVVVAIFQQSRVLRMQKGDFDLAKKDMKRSAQAQKDEAAIAAITAQISAVSANITSQPSDRLGDQPRRFLGSDLQILKERAATMEAVVKARKVDDE